MDDELAKGPTYIRLMCLIANTLEILLVHYDFGTKDLWIFFTVWGLYFTEIALIFGTYLAFKYPKHKNVP